MRNASKTKAQLLEEISALRTRVSELEEQNQKGKKVRSGLATLDRTGKGGKTKSPSPQKGRTFDPPLRSSRVKEAIQENEAQFRLLFEGRSDPMVTLNADLQFVHVNLAFCDLLGCTKQGLKRKGIKDFVHPDDVDQLIPLMAQLFKGDLTTFQRELRFYSKSKKLLRCTLAATVARDKDGHPTFAFATIQNACESRRGKKALDETHQERDELKPILSRYDESFVLTLGEIMYDYNVPKDFIKWNGACEQVLGCRLEEMGTSREDWLAKIHPDDYEIVTQEVEGAQREKRLFDLEYRFQGRDGNYIWLHDRACLQFSPKGQLEQMSGVIHDITELKRVENSLSAQKSILEQIALGFSLPTILTSLCHTIEAQADGLLCSILLLEGNTLRLGAAPSLPDSYNQKVDNIKIGPTAGSCGTAAFRKEQVIVSDIATDPLWERGKKIALAHGLRACWSTPILSSEGAVLGTFSMYYTHPRSPDPKEKDLVKVSTDLAGIAIEHKRSEEALQVQATQQALVADLGQLALTGVALPILMQKAVSLIAETLEVEYCKVLELLPKGEDMILRAGFGCPPEAVDHVTVGAGLDSQAGYTLVSDEPVIVEDLRSETRFSGPPLLHQLGVISGMSVIISGKPRHYGVLGVHSTQLRKFTRDDIHFVQAVANVLALAIERKRAEEGIARLSTIIESTTDCAGTADKDGFIVMLNQAGRKMLAVGESEDLSQSQVSEFHTQEAMEHMRAEGFPGAIRDGVWIGETTLLSRDGREIPVSQVLIAHKDSSGEVEYFSTIMRDIAKRKEMERVLLQSEARYRELYHENPTLYVTVDPDGVVKSVNQFGAHQLGYTPDEIIGQSLFQFVAEEDRGKAESQFYEWLNNPDTMAHWEFRKVRKDGSVFWVREAARIIPKANGDNFILIVGENISEKKATEKALQLTRFSVDHAGDAIFWIASDGRFIDVNEQACLSLRYSREELLSLSVVDIDPIFQGEKWKETWARIKYQPLLRLDSLHRTKSGETFPVEMTVNLLEFDGHEYACVFARNVTERRLAEEALIESERKFRAVAQSASDAIVSADSNGTIVFGNTGAEAIFGYEKGELLGKPLTVLMPARYHQDHHARIEQARKTGQSQITRQPIELNGLRKDGSEFPVEISFAMWEVSGKTFYSGIIRDITERRLAEEALRTSERAIRELYEIASSPDRSFEDRVRSLLELGCRRFRLPIGMITRRHQDHFEIMFIKNRATVNELFVEGNRIFTDDLYCCRTAMQVDEPICVEHVGASTWSTHPGFVRLGIESFLGMAVKRGQGLFGTICFLGPEPYLRAFSETDKYFLKHMTRWIEGEFERQDAEDELERQRKFLRQVIDMNPNFVFAKDREGHFTLVNEAVAEVYGTTVENLLGKTDSDFNPNVEEVEFFRQMDLEVMDSQQERFIGEEVITDARGNLHYLQTVKRPLVGEDGLAHHVLGVAADITARKQAEATLRAIVEGTAAVTNTDFFRSLLRHLVHALDVPYAFLAECVDSTNSRVRTLAFLNRDRFIENVEYDLEGTPCEEVISGHVCYHPKYVQRLFPKDTDLVALGVECYLGFPLRDSSGRVIGHLVIMSEQPVTFDEQTESFLKIFAARAGAELERQQAEAALKASEERYAMVMGAVNDGIWDWDMTNDQVYYSSTWKQQLGYEDQEITSGFNEWASRIHPEDYDRVMASLKNHLESNQPYELEHRLKHKNGTYVWILTRGACIQDGGGRPIRMTGSHSDVTQRREAEEKVRQTELQLWNTQKLNAIGTLAEGIAHDFNNILAAIMGYTELILGKVAPGETVHGYVKEVLTAGSRAKELVKQILTFSRQTEGRKRALHLQAVVQEVLTLIRASLPSTIEIDQQLCASIDLVEADSTQIHQVLMNLCTNAEYAMRGKGGVLTVRLETVEEVTAEALLQNPELIPGPHLLLTLSDTGHGISPEVMDRIFEPFFTTKQLGEGTGMGLAVVHGIIAHHHGRITVTSTPGAGTSFSIRLPLLLSSTMDADEELISADTLPQGGGHVLFVDDEVPLVTLGKELLDELGYEVTTQTNSLDALDAFRAAPDHYDVVITDQTMPNLSGEGLAGEIQKIRPELPIILCTGFSHTMNEEKARELGIRKFLMKPLLRRDLVHALQEVLGEADPKK